MTDTGKCAEPSKQEEIVSVTLVDNYDRRNKHKSRMCKQQG